MSVTEFECAIAKSQIGRYIAGEKLGQEVVHQLESHIAACARCKLVLEEKRNSLMSTIEADKEERIRTVSAPSIPMQSPSSGHQAPQLNSPRPETFGALARKFSEPVEGDPKEELRRQLMAMANKRTGQIEIPVVAPAFAHRDQTETVTLEVPEVQIERRKEPRFSLQSLALFKQSEEPEAEIAPANSGSDQTMKKPIAYMTGLTVVVIAMSIVAKNPTAMFGPKANDTRVVSAPIKPTKSSAAQKFAAIRKKGVAKVAPVKGPTKVKPVVIAKAKVAKKLAPIKVTAAKKAHAFTPAAPKKRSTKPVAKKTTSPKKQSIVRAKTKKSAPGNGTVKVYAPTN